MDITTEQIPQLLASAYEARDEVVLCLLGLPGIGKTQQLYKFAKDRGVKVVEIIASQILPNEVSGITMPVNETHSMEIYDHARLSSLKDGDILFFDELLQASPQTLSACLTLIQERRLMSGKMLPDIMIVAAANELPSATMIPMQIRQRFMFVNVKWDKTAWIKYMNGKHGINISSSCANKINFRDAGYNTLTPRTMSKLIAWRMQCKEEQARNVWHNVVTQEFGVDVANEIDGSCLSTTPKQQLKLVVWELLDPEKDDDVLLMTDWQDLSIVQIYERLQKLSMWPEIERALAETQLER